MDDGFLSKVVQELAREVRVNTTTLATLTADLANVSRDVNTLSKLLTEGNGSDPLMSRVALLESTTDGLEEAIDEISEQVCNVEVQAEQSHKRLELAIEDRKLSLEDSQDKRRSLVAIITSVIALLTSVVMSMFGLSGS